LRIFTAVRHANDPKSFYGDLWASNFYPALRRLGNEVVESKTDLLPTSRFMHVGSGFTRQELDARARTTERILAELVRAHRDAPIHLFLAYFYNAHFDPAAFDEVRRMGIPSINFYCNSVYQFGLVDRIAAKADFAWHPERDADGLYRAVGATPIWVQMGADPDVYGPRSGVARQGKACFVGQLYSDRARWASALLTAGVPLDLYGAGWAPRQNPSDDGAPPQPASYLGRTITRPATLSSYLRVVAGELRSEGLGRGAARLVRQWNYRKETRRLAPTLARAARGRAADLSRTFAAYDVVVNFSNVWADGRPGSALIPHVRLRDFEAPMCRTCYLTGHSDEIAEFYEIGKEIDTYRTEAELVDKARFYLANPAQAELLQAAGHARARRDHTWEHRFLELFRKTGLASHSRAPV
jgi:spore maturation protein CgeB